MKTSDANELVTIETFQSEIEAEIVKGRLMTAGIKSFIFKADCGGTRPHMQLTLGVDLKVRQTDFARASEVFESIGTSDRRSEDLKPGENKAAIYSFCMCTQFYRLRSSFNQYETRESTILHRHSHIDCWHSIWNQFA